MNVSLYIFLVPTMIIHEIMHTGHFALTFDCLVSFKRLVTVLLNGINKY